MDSTPKPPMDMLSGGGGGGGGGVVLQISSNRDDRMCATETDHRLCGLKDKESKQCSEILGNLNPS